MEGENEGKEVNDTKVVDDGTDEKVDEDKDESAEVLCDPDLEAVTETVPEKYTVYFGEYEGDEGLFMATNFTVEVATNEKANHPEIENPELYGFFNLREMPGEYSYSENQVASNYERLVNFEDVNVNGSVFNFVESNLVDPSVDHHVYEPALSYDCENIYYVTAYDVVKTNFDRDLGTNFGTYILDTGVVRPFYANDDIDPDDDDGVRAPFVIPDELTDGYAIASMAQCWACDGGSDRVRIYNVETLEYIELPTLASYSVEGNSLTYELFTTIDVECEDEDYDVASGYYGTCQEDDKKPKTVPSGELKSVALP